MTLKKKGIGMRETRERWASPLSCQDVVELLTAYLDEALQPADQQRVSDHLAACAGCRTYVDQIRQTRTTLGALPSPTLPAEHCARLVDAFRNWGESR